MYFYERMPFNPSHSEDRAYNNPQCIRMYKSMHVTWLIQLMPKLASVKKQHLTEREKENQQKWVNEFGLAFQRIHELGGWTGFETFEEDFTAEWEYWFRARG